MSNVIDFKRHEHVISETEIDMLATQISFFAKRYHDSMCLHAGIRKALCDALRRDRNGEKTEVLPQD